MNKVIVKASMTVAAVLTTGALTFAADGNAELVVGFVVLVAVVFGGLTLAAEEL